jgi:hypothetical protein
MTGNELVKLSFEEAKTLSSVFASSSLVPDALRGKEADVLFIVLTGQEMGIGPMTSMRTFDIVKGKVGMKSEAMVAHVRASPAVEYIRCVASTPQKAVWVSKLKSDREECSTEFTWQEAVTAGLSGQDMYKKWPKRMLQWRAASLHCKTHHSDIILGLYSTEEVESFEPRSVPSTGITPQNEAETIAALSASVTQAKEKKRLMHVPSEPAADYGQDGAPVSERAKLEVAVEEAQDEATLLALVERIARLAPADKASLRTRWGVRRDELKSLPSRLENVLSKLDVEPKAEPDEPGSAG